MCNVHNHRCYIVLKMTHFRPKKWCYIKFYIIIVFLFVCLRLLFLTRSKTPISLNPRVAYSTSLPMSCVCDSLMSASCKISEMLNICAVHI